MLVWVLAIASFFVRMRQTVDHDAGARTTHSVFPIGVVSAPACWALLALNRKRLTQADLAAGLVAATGLLYGLATTVAA